MIINTKAQILGITDFPYYEYDNKGNVTYYEMGDGYWEKSEYDDKGNETHNEWDGGYWHKRKYDDNRNLTYFGTSTGYKEYVII